MCDSILQIYFALFYLFIYLFIYRFVKSFTGAFDIKTMISKNMGVLL